MENPATQKLKAKELVTIGICTVIMKALYLVVMVPFMPIMSVALPFVWGVCMLVGAPVFMLMTYKAAKRGTVLMSLCACPVL